MTGDRLSVDEEDTDLRAALASRHEIGMAQGILMERHGLDPERAFDQLVKMSNESNRKLRVIAVDLVEAARQGPSAAAVPVKSLDHPPS